MGLNFYCNSTVTKAAAPRRSTPLGTHSFGQEIIKRLLLACWHPLYFFALPLFSASQSRFKTVIPRQWVSMPLAKSSRTKLSGGLAPKPLVKSKRIRKRENEFVRISTDDTDGTDGTDVDGRGRTWRTWTGYDGTDRTGRRRRRVGRELSQNYPKAIPDYSGELSQAIPGLSWSCSSYHVAFPQPPRFVIRYILHFIPEQFSCFWSFAFGPKEQFVHATGRRLGQIVGDMYKV